MDQQDRGKLMCDDLAWYGYDAKWFLDPFNELFLIIDNKWLMKCVGERDIDGEPSSYWVPVRPTHRSLMLRQLGKRKLEYTPLFE